MHLYQTNTYFYLYKNQPRYPHRQVKNYNLLSGKIDNFTKYHGIKSLLGENSMVFMLPPFCPYIGMEMIPYHYFSCCLQTTFTIIITITIGTTTTTIVFFIIVLITLISIKPLLIS